MISARMFDGDLYVLAADATKMAENAYKKGQAVERKVMMQLFTDPENQPTQHGTVTVEYMNRELNMMEEHCAELILAEREACAQLCAEDASGGDSGGYYAEIIRDRSTT